MSWQTWILGALLTTTLIGIGAGSLLYERPEYLGLCAACVPQDVLYGVAQPLYVHTWPLALTFFWLLFVSPYLFRVWAVTLLPFGVFALWIVIGTDPIGHNFMDVSRAEATESLTRAFAVGSVVVVTIRRMAMSITNRMRR